jgi:N-acetylmuramoyl-L-alanine amidase
MPKNKFRIALLFSLLSFMAGGCATLPSQPLVSTQSEIYLKDVCNENDVYWQWDPVAQVVTLGYRGVKAEVLVGSDLVIVDKERVTLSAPVRVVRSAVIVPRDFQSKVIGRLRRQATEQKSDGISQFREIIIDPGHGGKDPGAIGWSGEYEKKIVLDISLRLKRILQGKGVNVKMTRETDEFISLQQRTEIASRSKADLFISVHANSSPVRSVYGLEVFTAKYLGFKDRNAEQRGINQRLMFDRLSMERLEPVVEEIVSDMLYSHKQAESKQLARHLAKATAKYIKTDDRGEKESQFYVVKNTLTPAVLVEVGFISNPKESKLLQTSKYRQRVARGIAESILDYANDQ